MIKESYLDEYLEQNQYDIRTSGNGRWIDQKCTPDVLSIVADCIYYYVHEHGLDVEFSRKDIQLFDYTVNNIEEIFNKPKTNHHLSANEYDKFFGQPLKMFTNVGILNETRKGNRLFYTVNEKDILYYISLRERNALKFLIKYIKKVLSDSDLKYLFDSYLEEQTTSSFNRLKDGYVKYVIAHTPIKRELEPRRIFTKVLNPLAYSLNKKGTVRGRMSPHNITYSMLMYNQENFRDVNRDKPKGVSRQEWKKENKNKPDENYYIYQSQKAKQFLREYNNQFNNGESELNDEYGYGKATQMHHIFPQHEFPEISMEIENIIAITPTQHLTKAHPNNNTHKIDVEYQYILLKAKIDSIIKDLEQSDAEPVYSFEGLHKVLSVGLGKDIEVEPGDFASLLEEIDASYAEVVQ